MQTLWADINRRVHTRLVDVLEGNEGGRVTTANGEVVLDLSPLVMRLEDQLGVQTNLSPDAGKITIMTSKQLGAAQDAVQTIKVLSPILAIVVLVLLVLGVYLAQGFRREAVRAAAVGILVVGLVLLIVRRLAGNAVVDALTSPSTKSAGTQVWLISTSLLGDLALGLVAIAIVGLVWAWLSGSTRPAVWLRQRLAPAMGQHPAMVYGVVLDRGPPDPVVGADRRSAAYLGNAGDRGAGRGGRGGAPPPDHARAPAAGLDVTGGAVPPRGSSETGGSGPSVLRGAAGLVADAIESALAAGLECLRSPTPSPPRSLLRPRPHEGAPSGPGRATTARRGRPCAASARRPPPRPGAPPPAAASRRPPTSPSRSRRGSRTARSSGWISTRSSTGSTWGA